jgi:glutamine synthetase
MCATTAAHGTIAGVARSSARRRRGRLVARRTANDHVRLAERLRGSGARLLCGVVADSGGVLRSKSVPAERIEAFASAGMGASVTWPVFCVDNAIAMTDGLGVVGDLRLTTDLEAAVVLDRGFAWAPLDVRTQEGTPSPLCWRAVARRQQQRLADRSVSVAAGFEMEFTVLEQTGRPVGDEHGWPSYGLGPVSALSEFVTAVLERLADAGVPVEQVHAEYGVGQVEMSLPPTDAVAAADAVVLARTVVGRTAREHDLLVSFSPMPFLDGAGNGAHLHVSFDRNGAPLLTGGPEPAGLTTQGAQMVAGVVEGLPEAVAVLAGSVVSADRLVPDRWSGCFTCWGLENREAAVRLVADTPGNPHGASMEVKCIDAAANPYLAVGIVLGLALDGLEGQRPLPPEVTVNPAHLSASAAAEAGVRRLPAAEAALEQFAGSDRMRAVLGAELHGAVVAVRRHEQEAFRDVGTERHALTRFAWSA